ncbi:MAG: nucleotidyltransferase domain-containing protein [Methanomassiliicoccaceae archaeon]|nr:nucleotidyltransferase domain-containing protein [Methanomassiliicoccaceae archaeon]
MNKKQIADKYIRSATDTDIMSAANGKTYSIEELREIVAPVAERYGIDRIYLFGSRARGDCSEDSDYDFYVEAGKIKSLFEMTEFRLDLRDAIGNRIDVISTKRMDEKFRKNLMKERVLVYG